MACSSRRETAFECCMCKKIPEEDVVFYRCPSKHYYCLYCVQGLKGISKGIVSQSTCKICKFKGEFTAIHPSSFPRIAYKHGVNGTNGFRHLNSNNTHLMPSTSSSYDDDKAFETLIGVPKEHFRRLHLEQSKEVVKETKQKPPTETSNCYKNPSSFSIRTVKSKFSVPSAQSRKPLKCPHKPCHKTVATSQFVNHFKSEHCNIPTISLERGREVCLPFDVTVIEHGCHFCLAMITLYEINRIDFIGSKSSESVIRTASKFCQKLPINTFWLMVTGSAKKTEEASYSFFWLFTNSDESYKCTIELGSTSDSTCLSTYCDVTNSLADEHFFDVAESLNCLLATNLSLRSLLKEGIVLNLRVTIH